MVVCFLSTTPTPLTLTFFQVVFSSYVQNSLCRDDSARPEVHHVKCLKLVHASTHVQKPKLISSTPWQAGAKSLATESLRARSKDSTRLPQVAIHHPSTPSNRNTTAPVTHRVTLIQELRRACPVPLWPKHRQHEWSHHGQRQTPQ